jgi:hypothetical protein
MQSTTPVAALGVPRVLTPGVPVVNVPDAFVSWFLAWNSAGNLREAKIAPSRIAS